MALLLESLRIENYRAFERLEIPRLGRVNLLVGRNNSGKSSVLEAVRLYASRGSEEALIAILESHDALPEETEPRHAATRLAKRSSAMEQLFHGRKMAPGDTIRIGPVGGQRRIALGQAALSKVSDRSPEDPDVGFPYVYVSPEGLTTDASARRWDFIALTDLESNVIDALRIISPEIERISFIGESGRKRIPMAKLRSEVRPVPLRSLGDGVNRLLGIALSLASASHGILLIDEVENGIHFTAQQKLWELIFRLAHQLDTQVIATTHSWDCIEAFQKAAKSDENEEAALIRLDTQNGGISPVSFTERELAIVTREQIEVR